MPETDMVKAPKPLVALALALLLVAGAASAAQTLWDDPAFALYQQGVKVCNTKDYKQAEALARKAIGHYPNLLLAHYLLGRAAMVQEKWEEAIDAFNTVVTLYPESIGLFKRPSSWPSYDSIQQHNIFRFYDWGFVHIQENLKLDTHGKTVARETGVISAIKVKK